MRFRSRGASGTGQSAEDAVMGRRSDGRGKAGSVCKTIKWLKLPFTSLFPQNVAFTLTSGLPLALFLRKVVESQGLRTY